MGTESFASRSDQRTAVKYPQVFDGDIVTPVMKGYKMMCCSCFAVHRIDFFIVPHGRGHKVKFRARADARATAAARRKRKLPSR